MSRNPCTQRLLTEAVAYTDRLTDQGVPRSKALQHARARFGFTTKQIMSAAGRARIDPDGELAVIAERFAHDTVSVAGPTPAFSA